MYAYQFGLEDALTPAPKKEHLTFPSGRGPIAPHLESDGSSNAKATTPLTGVPVLETPAHALWLQPAPAHGVPKPQIALALAREQASR